MARQGGLSRRYLDATAEGLRQVVRGHPGQVALREICGEAELSAAMRLVWVSPGG